LSLRLRIRKAARGDIAEARRWYESERTGLGQEFIAAVRAALNRIEREPLQFPVVHKELRRLLVSRFPYGIYYLVLEKDIAVVAVTHSKRDPQTWMQRR